MRTDTELLITALHCAKALFLQDKGKREWFMCKIKGGGEVKLGKTVKHSLRNTGDPCQPQRASPREASDDKPQCHLVSVLTAEDDRHCSWISPWNGTAQLWNAQKASLGEESGSPIIPPGLWEFRVGKSRRASCLAWPSALFQRDGKHLRGRDGRLQGYLPGCNLRHIKCCLSGLVWQPNLLCESVWLYWWRMTWL